jgi:hypothetical protein
MGKLTQKIVILLVAVFFFWTVGYQVYLGLYGGTRTETVYEYTVSRSIPVEGIAIRSETLIEGSFSGISNYLFEDGERVSIGENVAEFYENDRSDRNLRRARELEDEIAMLKSAQEIGVNNFAATDMINRDIKEQLGFLIAAAEQRRYSSSDDIRGRLTELINKKQLATGMTKSFAPRVNELTAELSNLSDQERDSAVMRVTAPASGYFVRLCDGYETLLSPKDVADYGISELLGLLDSETPEPQTAPAGKIVRSQNWVFVAAADKSSLEFVKPGQLLDVSFESAGAPVPASVTKILQDKDEERAVLLLSCNYVSGPLLGVRRTAAELDFNQYSGLRVDMANVRFLNDERGVYVLEDGVASFKKLDAVYEDQNFVLSRFRPPSMNTDEYVKLFDQIIIRGNDLYDGKTIQ